MTERMKSVLDFIKSYIDEHGIAPTHQEISKACNLNSTGASHGLVEALVARGKLRRISRGARAIEIINSEDWDAGFAAGYAEAARRLRAAVEKLGR